MLLRSGFAFSERQDSYREQDARQYVGDDFVIVVERMPSDAGRDQPEQKEKNLLQSPASPVEVPGSYSTVAPPLAILKKFIN
jgi:hypothetical protein